MDAALYDLSPPKVTTLYAIPAWHDRIHLGEDDVRYPSAGVAERCGTRETALCSSSVRMDDACHCAQHGTYDRERREGKEVALNELPPWTEDKIKVFPVVRVPFPPFRFRLILRAPYPPSHVFPPFRNTLSTLCPSAPF